MTAPQEDDLLVYEALEARLLAFPGAVREFPFGPEVAVFKVGGKMFALAAWMEEPLRVTVKCRPQDAEFYRAAFEAVAPGYHMNKRHWNTLTLDGSLPPDVLSEMLETSYALVLRGLPRRIRAALQGGGDAPAAG